MCEVMQHYENIAWQKGMQQGILTTLISLVNDGLLPIKDAAARAGLSVEEFRSVAETKQA